MMSAPSNWPPALVTASYSVRAGVCPQVVSRMIDYFALRNLVPASVRVRRWDDVLTILIEQPDIPEREAEIIAEKMRSLVTVTSVSLECRISAACAMPAAA